VVRVRLREVFFEYSCGTEQEVELARACEKTFLAELSDFYELAVKEGFKDTQHRGPAALASRKGSAPKISDDSSKILGTLGFLFASTLTHREIALARARDLEAWLEEDFELLG